MNNEIAAIQDLKLIYLGIIPTRCPTSQVKYTVHRRSGINSCFFELRQFLQLIFCAQSLIPERGGASSLSRCAGYPALPAQSRTVRFSRIRFLGRTSFRARQDHHTNTLRGNLAIMRGFLNRPPSTARKKTSRVKLFRLPPRLFSHLITHSMAHR